MKELCEKIAALGDFQIRNGIMVFCIDGTELLWSVDEPDDNGSETVRILELLNTNAATFCVWNEGDGKWGVNLLERGKPSTVVPDLATAALYGLYWHLKQRNPALTPR